MTTGKIGSYFKTRITLNLMTLEYLKKFNRDENCKRWNVIFIVRYLWNLIVYCDGLSFEIIILALH